MNGTLKRAAVAALATVTCLSAMVGTAFAAPASFTDVPDNHWAYSYIQRAAAEGIVNGMGNNRFQPSGIVTSAQYVTMFQRTCLGWEPPTSSEDKYWYTPYYNDLLQLHLLDSTSLKEETLNNPIARNDMAQIVYNYYKRGNLPEAVDTMFSPASPDKINDYSKIPQTYRDAVLWAYGAGILGGDNKGNFNGSNSMNRAEASAVMIRMVDLIERSEQVQKDNEMKEVLEHSKISLYDTNPKGTYSDGRTYTKEYIEFLKRNAIDGERCPGGTILSPGTYEVPVTVNFRNANPNRIPSHIKFTMHVEGDFNSATGRYDWIPACEYVFDESTNLKDGTASFTFLIPYSTYLEAAGQLKIITDDYYDLTNHWVSDDNGTELPYDYKMTLDPDNYYWAPEV